MKTTAYGPRTTNNLRRQWRAIIENNYRHDLAGRGVQATRFACSTGLRPGTGRWYAAALWSYNQH